MKQGQALAEGRNEVNENAVVRRDKKRREEQDGRNEVNDNAVVTRKEKRRDNTFNHYVGRPYNYVLMARICHILGYV